MKSGKIYNIDHREYLILDGVDDMMPGRDGRKLLIDRRYGVGADYLMVFTGTDQEPSFLLFGRDGEKDVPVREAYVVLAKYLRDTHVVPNASEMVRHLGEQALLAGEGEELSSFEVRITDYFWQQILPTGVCPAVREIA